MRRLMVVFIIVIYLGVLGAAVAEMPEFGNPNNPVHNEVAERYIREGVNDTGILNMVSAIIVDYRAFDTLGEVTVLLVGITGLLIVLSQKASKD